MVGVKVVFRTGNGSIRKTPLKPTDIKIDLIRCADKYNGGDVQSIVNISPPKKKFFLPTAEFPTIIWPPP